MQLLKLNDGCGGYKWERLLKYNEVKVEPELLEKWPDMPSLIVHKMPGNKKALWAVTLLDTGSSFCKGYPSKKVALQMANDKIRRFIADGQQARVASVIRAAQAEYADIVARGEGVE